MIDKVRQTHIFVFAACCLIAGLLASRFLISIGMLFFLIAGLWDGGVRNKLKIFLGNRYFLSVSAIFVLYLISGLWSDNIEYFLNRLRIKLPILFLPFAFLAVAKLKVAEIKFINWFFILSVFVSLIWSLSVFVSNPEHYIDIYSKGQILPTPIHHIRYSIMLSIAVALGIYMLIKRHHFALKKFPAYSLGFLTMIFIVYQHFLAVRSGLMTLYILLIYAIIYLFLIKLSKRILLVGSVALGLVLIGSISFIPTIQKKINYMKYSLELFDKNEGIRHLSDSRRLGSIYAGVEITKNNPVIGVGIGDIMVETNQYLKNNYPELTDLELLPHNQFILTSAATGIPGCLLFITLIVIPFFYRKAYRNFFFMGSQFMMLSTFMVEHTIESQIGVALYIFVLLYAMKIVQSAKQESNA